MFLICSLVYKRHIVEVSTVKSVDIKEEAVSATSLDGNSIDFSSDKLKDLNYFIYDLISFEFRLVTHSWVVDKLKSGEIAGIYNDNLYIMSPLLYAIVEGFSFGDDIETLLKILWGMGKIVGCFDRDKTIVFYQNVDGKIFNSYRLKINVGKMRQLLFKWSFSKKLSLPSDKFLSSK